MKQARLITIFLTTLILITGCSPKKMLERIVPEDDVAFAEQYMEALLARDADTATRLLDPQFHSDETLQQLDTIFEILDQGEVVSKELIGANVVTTPSLRRSNLSYQYQFEEGLVLIALNIDTIDGHKQVYGVSAKPISQPIEKLNAFTLKNHSFGHYLMLALAIIIPLFSIATLILCIRTKMKKLKWLWIIFILIGLGKLTINWSTGALFYQPISVLLLGAGCFKPGLYGPWSISIALPLGAILFLLLRSKLRRKEEEPVPPPIPS